MYTMSEQKKEKLNWLQHHLPEGLVIDAAWLEKHGYSRSLRSKYTASGWLDQLAHGVYRREPAPLPASNDETLRWQHVVISLQTLYECGLSVGGRTALELQGFSHYLSAGKLQEIHIYGSEPPPGWVRRLDLGARIVFHNAKTLFRNGLTTRPTAKSAIDDRVELTQSGLIRQPWGHWDWPLTLSLPERAILELLDEIPQRETFHQADMLMEGLRNLSPRRLHQLLVDCRSVKVKRLFLWFAERHNHAWLKQLDRTDIDLGHGKRMLVRGGRLDPKYNITVPENLNAGG
jgi:Transcriptional regulator, AbiEi antitoxin, Type IV TA system/Transcriptional regulator, AbiEi antitoxin N-terminal domain